MKTLRKNLSLTIIFTLFTFHNVLAERSSVHAIFEIGLHTGGEKLAEVVYVGGYNSSVRAGALVSLAFGAGFPLSENWEAQVTFGIKGDSVVVFEGDVSFERYPLNALVFYRNGEMRIGGGVTYHINPSLDSSGILAGLNANFEDSLGYIFEIDYVGDARYYWGVRATFMDYQTVPNADVNDVTIDGNSIGFVMGARF